MAGPAPPASASQDELNAILRDALPRQGAWSDEEYLWLTDRSRRLIEFTDGYVQELPWPYLLAPGDPGVPLSVVPCLGRAAGRRGRVLGVAAARARGHVPGTGPAAAPRTLGSSLSGPLLAGSGSGGRGGQPGSPGTGSGRQADRLCRGGHPRVLGRRSPRPRMATPSTAGTPVAARPPRLCSPDSRPPWPRCSTPRRQARRAGGSGASALRCRTTCRRPRSSWERRCPPRYLVPSSNWACAFPRSAAWMSRAFSVSSMSCASPVPMATSASSATATSRSARMSRFIAYLHQWP